MNSYSGKVIGLPFKPRWRGAMLAGDKTMTTRCERYGWPGDVFVAFEHVFELTHVERTALCAVAALHYAEEGCDSPEAFREVWRKLHPRRNSESQQVYMHTFRLVGEASDG